MGIVEKKRYEALDGIRTFACIGIVMMHVLANGEFQLNGFVFKKIIPSFTNFVFLFMTISGFAMCCGYYEKFISGKVDLVLFYKKRYAKMWPFFAFLCLLELVISPSMSSLYEVIANLTLCFGLIPNANITVIGVGWFLGVVFAFYLLFPFFCSLLSSKRKAWGILIISYIMNYLCKVYFDAQRTSIVFCFVFFVVGGIIYLYRGEVCRNKYKLLISAILSITLVFVYFFVKKGVIVMLLFNAAILVLAMNLEGRNILNNKFTKFIGGISFEVYLCHMLIYRVVDKVHMLRITSNEYANYLLVTLIVFVGAVCFAFICQKLINWCSMKAKKLF